MCRAPWPIRHGDGEGCGARGGNRDQGIGGAAGFGLCGPIHRVVLGIGQRVEHGIAAAGDEIGDLLFRHAEGGGELGPVLYGDADRGPRSGIEERAAGLDATGEFRSRAGDRRGRGLDGSDGAFLALDERGKDPLVVPGVEACIGPGLLG